MADKNKFFCKIIISLLVITIVVVGAYFVFKGLGLTNLTKEQLQEKVASTGAIAPLVFIAVSFLQVTFVPIPGVVTILTGNYLFGFWLSFLYSYIGMMIGGIVAWWLGRVLGRPYINWLAGSKKEANNWLARLKGRETVFLFFAFLLPFFPDDLLCSVAGILPIKFSTFLILQVITRATSIGSSLLFMSGEVIPFSGWGIWVLGISAIICGVIFIVAIKNADKLNKFFDKIIDKLAIKKK